MTTPPAAVLVAHGTRDPRGREVVDALVARAASLLPEAEVTCAYVDVQEPRVDEAVAAQPPQRPVVVVPMLLSRGYHVQVDIERAVRSHPRARAAAPLGPDEALVPVLLDRLAAAGGAPGDPCVLVGAGSRLMEAAADTERMARMLAAARPGRVSVGYCSAAEPLVAQAVERILKQAAGPVTALPYLLAPGFFLRALEASGADHVGEPLGADPRVARLLVARARDLLVHWSAG